MEQVDINVLGEDLVKKFRKRVYRAYQDSGAAEEVRYVVEFLDNVSWLGEAPAVGRGMDLRSAAVNAFLNERMR